MNPEHTPLLKLLNQSGIPFQLAVEGRVRDLAGKHKIRVAQVQQARIHDLRMEREHCLRIRMQEDRRTAWGVRDVRS
ncbi:MAG: hypothetical protein R2712_26455 [Vicinamibacterales bacterium]